MILNQSEDRLEFEVDDWSETSLEGRWLLYNFLGNGGKGRSKIRYVVQYRPFLLEGYLDGELMITVNKRHLMNMEFERNVREHYKFYNKKQIDSSFKFPFDVNQNNDFTEMFDGRVERWPMGPRAISLDFELPYLAEFSGIPERAS